MAGNDNAPRPREETHLPPAENFEGNLSGQFHEVPKSTPYPLIDSDPHFRRVLRYYRTSDYLTWLSFTIGVPLFYGGLMVFWKTPRPLGTKLIGAKYWRMSTALGVTSGFLVSYQDVSKRFWGWTENSREVKMDMEEMVGKLRRGEPLYGVTSMDPYYQQVAASQSRYAQLKFQIFPFFNFANHNYHGVDVKKYYDALKAEDEATVARET